MSVLASDTFFHLFFKSHAFVFPIVSNVCAKLRTKLRAAGVSVTVHSVTR